MTSSEAAAFVIVMTSSAVARTITMLTQSGETWVLYRDALKRGQGEKEISSCNNLLLAKCVAFLSLVSNNTRVHVIGIE